MKQKPKNPKRLTLSDLVRGMQHCVNTSAEIAELHYARTFEKFFDTDGTLLTKAFPIGNGRQMQIPLLCLSHHDSLQFSEMHVKMHVCLQDLEQKETDTPFTYGEDTYRFTRGSLDVALHAPDVKDGKDVLAEIEMVYKQSAPPEAVSRLIEQINNSLQVQNVIQESEASV